MVLQGDGPFLVGIPVRIFPRRPLAFLVPFLEILTVFIEFNNLFPVQPVLNFPVHIDDPGGIPFHDRI